MSAPRITGLAAPEWCRGLYSVRPDAVGWRVRARLGASDAAVWCRDVAELRAVVADLRRRRFYREECARVIRRRSRP